ncbi:AMP-binding protein [Ferrovibrio terrae]|uniref:AMP-binding protein n=1 Tax=Ferrovibrio terrae TaxID=2594003 RepID=UPI003137B608
MSDVLLALHGHAAESRHTAFTDPAGDIDFRQLARRVAGLAATMSALPDTIGLLAPSSVEWLVADLAGWRAGKTIVPLPHFFSDQQLEHIVRDASVDVILTDPASQNRLGAVGIRQMPIGRQEMAAEANAMSGRRIVYTSGSTGTPKGVILGAGQICNSSAALMQVTKADHRDRHLSVLPFSLLLEAICGIYLPILAGGSCIIEPQIVAASGAEVAVQLGEAVERHRPTTLVLVPQLLQAWTMVAAVGRVSIPDSLRFVATGGAAIPDALAERAWELGIPVHEGYGLTECGSVVAVNAPGMRRSATVGRPLPGSNVSIMADGEIVVSSMSVADGYLNRTDGPSDGMWHTGDIGALDSDGYLQIAGRKDNLIVTANGRNISPEWIETMLVADPRIARAVVLPAADGTLAALLEPSVLGLAWSRSATPAALRRLITQLVSAAPGYAVPRHLRLLSATELAESGLLTPNGKPRRGDIAKRYAEKFDIFDDETETRHAVL